MNKDDYKGEDNIIYCQAIKKTENIVSSVEIQDKMGVLSNVPNLVTTMN